MDQNEAPTSVAAIDIRLMLDITETGNAWQDAITRAMTLMDAAKPTENDLFGFAMNARGFEAEVRSLRIVHRTDLSRISKSTKSFTVVSLVMDIVTEVASNDGTDSQISTFCKDLVEGLLVLSPQFLAGYNGEAGTAFTGATLEELTRTDMRPMLDPRTRRLVEWRNQRALDAGDGGDEVFMGLPDSWYDDIHFGCAEGHVSNTVLTTESRGDRCLACGNPACIIPAMTETEFAAELAAILPEALSLEQNAN